MQENSLSQEPVRHLRSVGRPAVCREIELMPPWTTGGTGGTDATDGSDTESGTTLAVYLPPGTPSRVRELLHEQIAGLLSRTRRGNGPQVVWQPGNPLNLPE